MYSSSCLPSTTILSILKLLSLPGKYLGSLPECPMFQVQLIFWPEALFPGLELKPSHWCILTHDVTG